MRTTSACVDPFILPAVPSVLTAPGFICQLDAMEPSGSDPEQLAHVRELLAKLDAAGIVASTGHQEGGEDWEDESDGEAGMDVE